MDDCRLTVFATHALLQVAAVERAATTPLHTVTTAAISIFLAATTHAGLHGRTQLFRITHTLPANRL